MMQKSTQQSAQNKRTGATKEAAELLIDTNNPNHPNEVHFIPESEDSKGIYHPPTTHIRTQQAADFMTSSSEVN